ncbi:MAG: hypothetical protein ACRDRJ_25290 [Streptosporangiaceae bacterium]
MEADRPRQGEIQVIRQTTRLRDRPFEYVVWIDRVAAGRIRTGETRQYRVAPGPRSIRVGIAGRLLGSGRLWTSRTRQIDAHEGETVTLTCRPTAVHEVWDLVRPHRRVQLSGPISQRSLLRPENPGGA